MLVTITTYLSIYTCIHISIYLPIYSCIHLFIRPSIHSTVYLFIQRSLGRSNDDDNDGYNDYIDFSENLMTRAKTNSGSSSSRSSSSSSSSSSMVTQSPMIRRFGSENFAAKWQENAEHYLGLSNLKNLNSQLIKFQDNRSKVQKNTLLNELTLTYFARFHHVMREEYQFEQNLIEKRLKTWSIGRLAREGYAIVNMRATLKSNLYQDKVGR